MTTKAIFTEIYELDLWGVSCDLREKFFSGPGSHDPKVVVPYINAVSVFLKIYTALLSKKPNIVDLGCGDFSVGSKIRDLCNNCVACDIVEPVINRNKKLYQDRDVDFRVLDFTNDELPDGDIAIIRQVLQHLSNEKISLAIQRIATKYKYILVTEHLPTSDVFTPNRDMPTGPGISTAVNSGVVLTRPPFDIQVAEDITICEVTGYGGLIRTNLYRLP